MLKTEIREGSLIEGEICYACSADEQAFISRYMLALEAEVDPVDRSVPYTPLIRVCDVCRMYTHCVQQEDLTVCTVCAERTSVPVFTHQLVSNSHIDPDTRRMNHLDLWGCYNVIAQPSAEHLTLMRAEDVTDGRVGLGRHFRELHNIPEMVYCYLPTGSIWW